MAGRCTATGRFARPAIQVFARTRFRRSKHIGGLGPTPHLVGQAPHRRGTPSDRSGASNPSRRSADGAVSGSSLTKPWTSPSLSITSASSDTRCRRENRQRSRRASQSTDIDAARPSKQLSIIPAGLPPTMQQRPSKPLHGPALPPWRVYCSTMCSSRYSFTGRTGLLSHIEI